MLSQIALLPLAAALLSPARAGIVKPVAPGAIPALAPAALRLTTPSIAPGLAGTLSAPAILPAATPLAGPVVTPAPLPARPLALEAARAAAAAVDRPSQGPAAERADPSAAFDGAAPAPESELAAALALIRKKHSVVGLSVIVVKGGMTHGVQAGLADRARSIPVTDRTIFRLASISKTVTAAAVMQLWEKKTFELDDEIGKHLGYSVANPRFPGRAVTIRQLLTHTSSVRDGENYEPFIKETYASRRMFIKDLMDPGGKFYAGGAAYSAHEPGSRYEYSNLGFALLGTLVEKLSGRRFDEYAAEHVFKPLGMTASFTVKGLPGIADLAVLYRKDRRGRWVPQADDYRRRKPKDLAPPGYVPGDNGLTFSPQGGLRASPLELAKFLMALNGAAPAGTPPILSPETLALMREPHEATGKRGLGLRLTGDIAPGETWAGHSGVAYGFLGDMYFQKGGDAGIIIATNGSRPGVYKKFTEMQESILAAALAFLGRWRP